MKMFSDCSGECNKCYIGYVGGCLAGHGDDDFIEMTEERAREALKKGFIKDGMKESLYKLFPNLRTKK